MTIRIFTPETEFCQDLADVARLFYGDAPVLFNQEGEADLVISHEAAFIDGAWQDRFFCRDASASRAQEDLGRDALEQKRLRKRAVKLCLYALLKETTGMRRRGDL